VIGDRRQKIEVGRLEIGDRINGTGNEGNYLTFSIVKTTKSHINGINMKSSR